MTNEELKSRITALNPGATYEEGGEWLNVVVSPDSWASLAASLRNEQDLDFNYMFCLTCVDWKTHLTMVYHLFSFTHKHTIVVKAKLDSKQPVIGTVCDIWRTAEFHEREVYEMFGVHFDKHPDLRLLILPDGWEGKNPLRKDFEDPINMIRL